MGINIKNKLLIKEKISNGDICVFWDNEYYKVFDIENPLNKEIQLLKEYIKKLEDNARCLK